MLLERSFGSFLKQCVDTLIEILTGHVIVDDAEPRDEDSAFVVHSVDLVGDLHELALLLDQLDLFSVGPTLRYSDTLLFAIRLLLIVLRLAIVVLLIKDRILGLLSI